MVFARLLLLMFCIGQYMVFAHTHIKQLSFSCDKHHHAVIKEHCDVCDTMHHSPAMAANLPVYFVPAVLCITLYADNTPAFTPVQLVLAAGRAPPFAC